LKGRLFTRLPMGKNEFGRKQDEGWGEKKRGHFLGRPGGPDYRGTNLVPQKKKKKKNWRVKWGSLNGDLTPPHTAAGLKIGGEGDGEIERTFPWAMKENPCTSLEGDKAKEKGGG